MRILVGDRKLGECTASWLTLDMQTRRPLKLSLGEDRLECRADGTLDLVPEKIPPLALLDEAATFRVRNSDLDLNGHVNNTRYAQWILDSVPQKSHAAYDIDVYEVNFLSETHVDDVVAIERGKLEPSAPSTIRLQFQGKRQTDAKTVFLARLGVSRRSP